MLRRRIALSLVLLTVFASLASAQAQNEGNVNAIVGVLEKLTVQVESPANGSTVYSNNATMRGNITTGNTLLNISYANQGFNRALDMRPLVAMWSFNNLSTLSEDSGHVTDQVGRVGNALITNYTGSYIGPTAGKVISASGGVLGTGSLLSNGAGGGYPGPYMTAGGTNSLSFLGNNFTIVVWVKPTVLHNEGAGNYNTFFDYYDNSRGLTSYTAQSGYTRLITWNTTGGQCGGVYNTVNLVQVNQWNMVAYTVSGAGRCTYVNGANVCATGNTAQCSTIGPPNTYLRIGGSFWGAINGTLDDMMIFNRTLTTTELDAIYLTNLYKTNPTSWRVNVVENMSIGNHNITFNACSDEGDGIYCATDTHNFWTSLGVNGLPCASSTDCGSGNCVDGVCCSSACSSTCQRCAGSSPYWLGTNGTCSNIVSTYDPDVECGGSCGQNTCSGSASCNLWSGQRNCSVCMTCTGTSTINCIPISDNLQDSEGNLTCTGTCQKCSSGTCVYQGNEDLFNHCPATNCGTGLCQSGNGTCDWYTSGEGNIATSCLTCDGAISVTPLYVTNHTRDTQGSYQCTSTCQECLGGTCANQPSTTDYFDDCSTTDCNTGYCSGTNPTCGVFTWGDHNIGSPCMTCYTNGAVVAYSDHTQDVMPSMMGSYNVLGYWPMNNQTSAGESSQYLVDFSNYRRNSITLSTNQVLAASKFNKGISFIGDHNGIQLANYSDSFYQPANNWTYNIWFKMNSKSGTGGASHSWLFSNGYNSTGNSGFTMGVYSGYLASYEWHSGCGGYIVSNTNEWNTGQWYMMTVVRNSTSEIRYLNGQKATYQAVAACSGNTAYGNTPAGYGVVLGSIRVGTGYGSVNGTVDELSFWNKALNDSEVAQLYAAYTEGQDSCSSPCMECRSGACVNEINNTDYFDYCGAVSCDSTAQIPFYWGYNASNICLYRSNAIAAAATCNGYGYCQDSATICAQQTSNGPTSLSCPYSTMESDCSGASPGFCLPLVLSYSINQSSIYHQPVGDSMVSLSIDFLNGTYTPSELRIYYNSTLYNTLYASFAVPVNGSYTFPWNTTNVTAGNYTIKLSLIDSGHPSSLVAFYYRFDNNATLGENSTLYRDSGLYNNSASMMSGAGTNTTGQYGNALTLNGVNNWVNSTTSGFAFGATDFSVSAWINTLDTGGSSNVNGNEIISWGSGANKSVYLWVYQGNVGISNNLSSCGFNAPVADGSWHHIVATYSWFNATDSIYVDGSLVANCTGMLHNTQTTDVVIGSRVGFTGSNSLYAFNGSIDELQVWKKTLSAGEVSNLYTTRGGPWYQYGTVNLTGLNLRIRDNYKSTVDPVSITGGAGYDTNKTCNITFYDADENQTMGGLEYLWRKNVTWLNVTTPILTPDNFDVGDNILCSARANDTYEWGPWGYSPVFVIGDVLPPILTNLTADPLTIYNGATVQFCYHIQDRLVENPSGISYNAVFLRNPLGTISPYYGSSAGNQYYCAELETNSGAPAFIGTWHWEYLTVRDAPGNEANATANDTYHLITVLAPPTTTLPPSGGGGGGGGPSTPTSTTIPAGNLNYWIVSPSVVAPATSEHQTNPGGDFLSTLIIESRQSAPLTFNVTLECGTTPAQWCMAGWMTWKNQTELKFPTQSIALSIRQNEKFFAVLMAQVPKNAKFGNYSGVMKIQGCTSAQCDVRTIPMKAWVTGTVAFSMAAQSFLMTPILSFNQECATQQLLCFNVGSPVSLGSMTITGIRVWHVLVATLLILLIFTGSIAVESKRNATFWGMVITIEVALLLYILFSVFGA